MRSWAMVGSASSSPWTYPDNKSRILLISSVLMSLLFLDSYKLYGLLGNSSTCVLSSTVNTAEMQGPVCVWQLQVSTTWKSTLTLSITGHSRLSILFLCLLHFSVIYLNTNRQKVDIFYAIFVRNCIEWLNFGYITGNFGMMLDTNGQHFMLYNKNIVI